MEELDQRIDVIDLQRVGQAGGAAVHAFESTQPSEEEKSPITSFTQLAIFNNNPSKTKPTS